jgi:molecular chaperone GrpE
MAIDAQTPANTPSSRDAAEVARLTQEIEREHEMYLRALADFDNFRRRVEREREARGRESKRDLLLSLTNLMDTFERALPLAEVDPAGVAEGLRAAYRDFRALLESQGVVPFESVGKQFDPQVHEAVDLDRSARKQPGTVVEEVRRGYTWEGELLRPAQVKVAK